ncbi:MAG: hypothetical protein WB581_08875 [Halobacteriota archaeon]
MRILGEDEHNKDKKLHNFDEKLHNSAGEGLGEEEAHDETSYQYTENGNVHSAPQHENESTRLVDLLPIDWQAYFDDIVVDSEARWARLAPQDEEELVEDPEFEYSVAIADHLKEIAKKAMKREAVTLTPQPITLIPAPTPSSTQTQSGAEGAKVISSSTLHQKEHSLSFSRDELDRYVTYRTSGLAQKSRDWINRSSKLLWDCTIGAISHHTVETLRERTLEEYTSTDSHSKVLNFAKSFLKFLAMTRAEPRYQTFTAYLEPPKTVKERKNVTSRIVTKEDISNVLQHIEKAQREGEISSERSAKYSAFVLFEAYTGQRSEATTAKLRVGQFRTALAADKPVLLVDSSQDKVRMSHYVPLAPRVVEALKPLLAGRNDDQLMFTHSSFLQWIKRQKISMSRFQKPFVLGDLRKFAEQYGDIIQWDQSNRAYILTHGVSGVEWGHYRNPLPENVYDIYMKYWRDVDFTI